MAFSWGESWDCYALPADTLNGYWDSGTTTGFTLVAGRFAGSQAMQLAGSSTAVLVKSSGQNDGVHHLTIAFRQSAAISGSTTGGYLELLDGTTAQCTIFFRSDGAIHLYNGFNTLLIATYAGAFTVVNTWYAFEFEITISNTTGRFRVRKNGNPVDDFDSGAVLDTQNSANAYANKLTVGINQAIGSQQFDDLYWRSDASSVAWMGDIKCIARAPASDASVQFSRLPSALNTANTGVTTGNIVNGTAWYSPVVQTINGTLSSLAINIRTGYTGNLKCAVFAHAGANQPGTVIQTAAAPISNPVTGYNTFTFSPPVALARGSSYWIGFVGDTAVTGGWNSTGASGGIFGILGTGVSYASFPVGTPTITTMGQNFLSFSFSITPTDNNSMVSDAQQDATTTYVYDSTVGHADLYGIAPIASTPLTTFAVVTRAYMIKSDAGTRTAAVQLKSGSSTVASPTIVLTPSNWQWAWRHDTTDPATGAAWTAAAVNTCTVGPVIVA